MEKSKNGLTGYPSIDKPWLKYYSEEIINVSLPDCTIYEYMYNNNKDYPKDYAINYFGKRITFGELFENIDKTAQAFISIGVNAGDIVTIMSLACPETVYCFYALNKIGAIVNMITVLASENEIVHYLEEANSDVFVVLSLFNLKVENALEKISSKKVINIDLDLSMPITTKVLFRMKTSKYAPKSYMSWKEFINNGKNASAPLRKNPRNFGVLSHTGGTTGTPKGVMLSDYSVNGVAREYSNIFMPRRKEKLLNTIVPFVIYGLCVNLHMPLCAGLETILLPKTDTEKIADIFLKYKPNHIPSTPPYIAPLAENKAFCKSDLSFIKTLGTGGDGMTPELEKRLNIMLQQGNSSARTVNGYGLTEVGATASTSSTKIAKSGSVGIPLPQIQIAAFDTDDKELKYGEQGEICINSPYLMKGYFENPQATNEIVKLHNDGKKWLHTGDLGYVDEDGVVFICGRIKRIILTSLNGTPGKIFPDRVEEIILKHNMVEDCCVVSEDPEVEQIHLVAFITLQAEAQVEKTLNEIKRMCCEQLPEYSVPFRYEVINALPLTAAGKVDYLKLEKVAREL